MLTLLNGMTEMKRAWEPISTNRLWMMMRHLIASITVAVALPAAWAANDQAISTSNESQTVSAPKVSGNLTASPQPAARPLWHELTPAQQQALAPLASEWNKLDSFRKNKWLAIGNKFTKMTPDEQQRIQERMRDWVTLTPEQRRVARESYVRTKKLDSDQKSAHWEKYQQLSDEQKKKLAAGATAKKPVATLPSPATRGNTGNTVPPIKSAPQRVLEQSVTPQAASQSAIPSSIPPAK